MHSTAQNYFAFGILVLKDASEQCTWGSMFRSTHPTLMIEDTDRDNYRAPCYVAYILRNLQGVQCEGFRERGASVLYVIG